MTCRLMRDIERIAKDIERQYGIQLDPQYVERMKRPLCSYVCGGQCREEYIEHANTCNRH